LKFNPQLSGSCQVNQLISKAEPSDSKEVAAVPSKGAFVLSLLVLLLNPTASGQGTKKTQGPARQRADMQFFGDLYIPQSVIKATGATPNKPAMFARLDELLASSTINIANFEGVATESFIPAEFKSYLLKMPIDATKMIRRAGIGIVTLANNHAMDFGYLGLFDTMAALDQNAIVHTGAGKTLADAVRPALFSVKGRMVCLLAFSRTLPESFWAGVNTPGTASLAFGETGKTIQRCKDERFFTVASFHWGQELSPHPKKYQRTLAALAIKSGADLVIGHHPHVIQTISFVEGKPVIYSAGNFVFGTLPLGKKQEGLAVRVYLSESSPPEYGLVELNVDNEDIDFRPKPLSSSFALKRFFEDDPPCRYERDLAEWRCRSVR